jgi:hypothetical protein
VRMYWFHFAGGGAVGRTGLMVGMGGGGFWLVCGAVCCCNAMALVAFLASRRRLLGLPVVLAYVWYVAIGPVKVTWGGRMIGGATGCMVGDSGGARGGSAKVSWFGGMVDGAAGCMVGGSGGATGGGCGGVLVGVGCGRLYRCTLLCTFWCLAGGWLGAFVGSWVGARCGCWLCMGSCWYLADVGIVVGVKGGAATLGWLVWFGVRVGTLGWLGWLGTFGVCSWCVVFGVVIVGESVVWLFGAVGDVVPRWLGRMVFRVLGLLCRVVLAAWH